MYKRIAVFDFDGTITTRDTFVEFTRFAAGNLSCLVALIRFLPQLTAYKLHLYPNWKVKEKIFSHFFKGVSEKRFNAMCESFFRTKGERILCKKTCNTIRKHQNRGDAVLIVSAGISNWIRPFGKYLKIDEIIGTEIATDSSGCLTGKFLTRNCYGMEKVNRIKQLYPNYQIYTWIAYGDSSGDKELLEFADERNYRIF